MSQRSFFERNWIILRGLSLECGFSGVNDTFFEDGGYLKNDARSEVIDNGG